MLGAEPGGLASDLAIERDYLDSQAIEELIDPIREPGGRWPHERLAIGAGRHHQVGLVELSQARPGAFVMGVGGIEEPDRDAGVKRYRSHSDRSSSRWPGG